MTTFYALMKRKEGATAIEFAIIAPVLFLLLFGLIEFSLIMFASSVVEGATANIARLSKTGAERSETGTPAQKAAADTARLRQLVLQRGHGVLRDANLHVTTTPRTSQSGSMGNAGEMVVYNVSYDWKIITPLMGPLLGDEEGYFPISSTTVVVNEPYDD